MVLVVDDDVFTRMGASDMFLDAGYEVLDAGSADEALRFFETGSDIRLLFTDVSMPGAMNGADSGPAGRGQMARRRHHPGVRPAPPRRASAAHALS